MSDASRSRTVSCGEEPDTEEVPEDVVIVTGPVSDVEQPSSGAVCCIEDIFSLQLLDQLRTRFLQSIPSFHLIQEEVATGGYMSLSQFANSISSLLRTDEYTPHLKLLFEKLDTRGSGFLSWSKFCSYLLTYLREKTQAELRGKQLLQKKPSFVRMPSSKQVTVLVVLVEALKKLLLVSKDGVLSLWNSDLTPHISCKLDSLLPGPIKLRGAPRYKHRAKIWVTSAVYFSQMSKLVLSATSSDIYFISLIAPSSFVAQYQLTELPSPVFSLACHERGSLRLLLCGCADGSLLVLRFLCPEQGLFLSELSSKRVECIKVSGRSLHKYYQFVSAASYQVHSHWVRRVEYLPAFQSALSCCHSNRISLAITDLQRIKQPYHFSLPKGVSCFDYCHELSLLLTGAVDRVVRVWCPYVPAKPSGLLMGHEGFIADVMVYYPKRVFLSLDTRGMVRIWDAVWNNCIQFIQLNFPIPPNSWEFGQRALFAGEQQRYIYSACANYMASFVLAPGNGDTDVKGIRGTSLKAPPCAALYAPLFKLVLVGSEDSSIFAYDLNSGRRQHVVQSAHGEDEITAMCVSPSGRRLITSSRLGQSKAWDVNTGELVQTFFPASPIEVTSLIPVESKEILIAAGWSKEIIVYKDRPEEVDQEYPHKWHDSKHHKEDILCADHLFPYVVTGSYDGVLIAWNIETEKELCRTCSGIKSRIDVPKRPPSRQGDIFSSLHRPSSHKLSSRERGRRSPSRLNLKTVIQEEPVPIDALLFLKERFSKRNKQIPHLVSSEGGCAVFWNIFNFSRPRQTLRLSRYQNEAVLGLATDLLNNLLISGDTRGEIRVFSLNFLNTLEVLTNSGLVSGSKRQQNVEPIVSWRAHDSAIVSVEFVPRDDTYFILSASVDRNVRLWTAEGNFVGNFGTQSWDIKNPASYQHPKTPWGFPKQKVQIISKQSSREGSHASLVHSSPAHSILESQEDLDVFVLEVSDRNQQPQLPSIRIPNILTQSSKFFNLQPNLNLEPELLTASERLLHIKQDNLIGPDQKETIHERMIRRSERRLRSNAFNLDKTERFPMLCSAHQALDLIEIRSPDIQPISLPLISRPRL